MPRFLTYILTLMLCTAPLAAHAAAPAPAPAPAATEAAEIPAVGEAVETASNNYMAKGSQGWQVAELQKNLRTLGYFHYPRNTGYYGPITTTAVRKFQRAYQLPITGAANFATITAIKRAVVKKRMIANSTKYIGIKYVWGAESPSVGFDCSGFVHYMFASHGVKTVPRSTSAGMWRMGKPVSRAHLKPGDLVFFAVEGRAISHVGFYMGNNKFISATASKGIWVYSMNNSYWGPHYVGAKRVY